MNENKPLVLIIDDDFTPMELYVKALQLSNFEVHQSLSIDQAMKYLNNYHDIVKIIVLDIMMPPGHILTAEETEEGLNTGVLFYENLKSLYPQIPIVVLTNVRRKDTLDALNSKACNIYQKSDFTPYRFVEIVNKIIGL